MRVRILAIEATRFYKHQHPMGLEAARQHLAELEALQLIAWKTLENEPLPGRVSGFLSRTSFRIQMTAALRQLIADTCEVRTLIARRHVAVLEAGLSLHEDDRLRLVVDLDAGSSRFILTVIHHDALQRQRGKEVDEQECPVPYTGELSRAVLSHVKALRRWKAEKARQGDPFVQPRVGREVWINSDDPEHPPQPLTLRQLRKKRLLEDFAAFLSRERAVRKLGAERIELSPRVVEMLEQCKQTMWMADDARKMLRLAGDYSEPTPTHFSWELYQEQPARFVWFVVQFNGSKGPVVKMCVEHEAIPARVWIAPEKALREWEAVRLQQVALAPREATLGEDIAALDLDNVTPRMAVDILYELQKRARREITREERADTEIPSVS